MIFFVCGKQPWKHPGKHKGKCKKTTCKNQGKTNENVQKPWKMPTMEGQRSALYDFFVAFFVCGFVKDFLGFCVIFGGFLMFFDDL